MTSKILWRERSWIADIFDMILRNSLSDVGQCNLFAPTHKCLTSARDQNCRQGGNGLINYSKSGNWEFIRFKVDNHHYES